jgi:phosphoglycolate phosphatase
VALLSGHDDGVRVAIFDCDGTLIDGQANILRAVAAAFAHHGLDAPPPACVRRIVGLSLEKAFAVLLPEGDRAIHAALATAYRDAFHAMRADRTLDPEPLFPGIAGLLERMAQAGWQLGIATGKSSRGLRLALDAHGIGGCFTSLQTADHHPSKPHPAMLEAALAECGGSPAAALMIGDTCFDMAMARAAGVRPIGVGWGYHSGDELLAAGAAAVAADAADLGRLIHG